MNSLTPILLDQEDLSSTTQGNLDRYKQAYVAISKKTVLPYIESNPSVIFVGNWADLVAFTSPVVSISPNPHIVPGLEKWADVPGSSPLNQTRSAIREVGESVPVNQVSQEPLIIFEPDAMNQIGTHLLAIEEAIDISLTFSSQNNISIGAVRVSYFVSKDDPSFSEIFLSFYSSTERQKIIDFFPVLSEHLGEWGNNQPDSVRTALTSKLTIEILPIDLW